MNPAVLLDELYELRQRQANLDEDMQIIINSILTPEIQAQIEEVKAEYAEPKAVIAQRISDLEDKVKAATVAQKATLKGTHLMCTYTKGRTSWNTKALNDEIKSHPWLAHYKDSGAPYGSIKEVKQ